MTKLFVENSVVVWLLAAKQVAMSPRVDVLSFRQESSSSVSLWCWHAAGTRSTPPEAARLMLVP